MIKRLSMCDLKNMRNPQAVVEVVNQCVQNMQLIEDNHLPTNKCITGLQTEINERMRVTLIAWLVEVHLKFKLVPETLYITVNLIDRYTERVKVRR